ncbi:hypothetical protein FGIG_11084 [Fasciola gigantica]|uniref:Uncharacterized protein n=1 Tax=Fasciola gigantica TaxID=46835 RepID=A0A504YPE0_FASGI|nr:hypothetical protein FGIG_11084 [Fasciola gigantica]
MLVLLSLLVPIICYSNIDAEACYDAPTQNKLYEICGGKVKFVTETTFWYKTAVRLLTLDSAMFDCVPNCRRLYRCDIKHSDGRMLRTWSERSCRREESSKLRCENNGMLW